jgi:hypothetical protein
MIGRLFTADDAWKGGGYELALEVGPRSDDRLRAALMALWQHPDLEGCYLHLDREPSDQRRVAPDGVDDASHLLGVARLPHGSRVVCGSCLIREVDDGPDWLVFYLPLGSLGTAYPVGGFPFGTEADWPGTWREEIEDWLAQIGLSVAHSAFFQLGLIGWEVSGQEYADTVASRGVPAERFIGYLWPTRDTKTGTHEVKYYRRTAS